MTLPFALGIACWGGLVGDRGHRKGQLRVLGSPSARHAPRATHHTKAPRTPGPEGHRGGGESADPIFFCESPFVLRTRAAAASSGLLAASRLALALALAARPVGDDSRFFALLGSAPQELTTGRPEAKLT
jgi:hypothetical protein